MKKYPLFLTGILLAAGVIAQEDYQRAVYLDGADSTVQVNISNNTNNEVRLVNANGNDLEVDLTTRAIVTIDGAHHEKHEGDSYHVGQFDLDLDTAETNGIILIVANTTKWPHMTLAAENTVAANGFIYRGVTLTATGAVMTAFNDDHNSTNTAGMLAYEWTGSTNSSLGTLVDEHLFGAAGPGNFGTGGSAERPEVILKQNTVYAIFMVGVADNGRMNMDLSWYEHTTKTD